MNRFIVFGKTLAQELEKIDLAWKEIDSKSEAAKSELEEELARRKNEYEAFYSVREKYIDEYKNKICQDALADREAQRILLEKERAEAAQRLEEERIAFAQRIARAENESDARMLKKHEAINEEIKRKRDEVDHEIKRRMEETDGEIANKRKEWDSEYKRMREDIYNFKKSELDKINEQRETVSADIQRQRNEFDKYKQTETNNINNRQAELDKRQSELDIRENEIDLREKNFREMQDRQAKEDSAKRMALDTREGLIDSQIEEGIEKRKREYEQKIEQLEDCNERLLEEIKRYTEDINAFKELGALGGGDPVAAINKMREDQEIINKLRQEINDLPSREKGDRFDEFKAETERLRNENKLLKEALDHWKEKADESKVDDIVREKRDLDRENQSLKDEKMSLERRCNTLQAELDRLTCQNNEEREERIKSIKGPCSRFASIKPRKNDAPTETEWLADIEEKIKSVEFEIPQRILYAFHTSLKIAEWSPITVLAGVSGTGKSELPRLYSHFGGINYLSLPVQPNWDSQESMLGFFNSIDNKFEAQPVLQLLAQSQEEPAKKDGDYPGLSDTMSIILLDEMNLAHIEQYFAEFLSKLEERRGLGKDEVTSLSVKLGSGMQNFDLKMGRNILWVGTMNQDETTKSLSDKVLDRGIVINFPRPTKLKRKAKQTLLPNPADLLLKKTWGEWWRTNSTLEPDEIQKYKGFIEEMNQHLAHAGRALGHRVWQSIEYYMSNYPVTPGKKREELLRIAFEDQLVQKVMPKLRGIETRGKSDTECLKKIREQLANNGYESLVKDFEFACNYGDGQFIWNSAYYIDEDSSSFAVTENVSDEGTDGKQ